MDASFKPYLLRAVYDWCLDKGYEPYLAVAIDASCSVPPAYVTQGQIVLDISPEATKDLDLGLEAVTFQARFGGIAHQLYMPMHRIIGLFPQHDQTLGAFFEPTTTPTTIKVVQSIKKTDSTHFEPVLSIDIDIDIDIDKPNQTNQTNQTNHMDDKLATHSIESSIKNIKQVAPLAKTRISRVK